MRVVSMGLRGAVACGGFLLAACGGYNTTAVQLAPGSSPAHGDARPNEAPRAKVLLLGTFHFRDPGLNQYKPKHEFPVFSPEGQRHIREVADLLAAYRPTKIAVEAGNQARLDSLYREYVGGRHELRANEVYQLGFRLARMLGHERVYGVDAERSRFFLEHYKQNQQQIDAAATADQGWKEYFTRLSTHDDSLKTTWSLRDHYRYMNTPERIRQAGGSDFVGWFRAGGEESFTGPDAVTGWVNRNLRIFRNIQRITHSPPEDRILVIYGSGHVPLLRYMVEASPEYELVEVEPYLSRR